MSWEKHEDDCPGCRPAMMNMQTKQILPDDSPEIVAILGEWAKTTLEQRQAWHRITCQGSTDRKDHELVRPFINASQDALQKVGLT